MQATSHIALAIRFKEYLLLRDISSRRIILDHCIQALSQYPIIVAWVQNLRAINDQFDAKDRKDQLKADAFWNDLILTHASNSVLRDIMRAFTRVE